MLSVEHVRASRRGHSLVLRRIAAKERERALAIVGDLLAVVQASVGCSREEIAEALDAIELAPNERRLALGLRKLVEDASEYAERADVEPSVLRSQLFLDAARARRAATLEAPFRRDEVLAASAAKLELDLAGAELVLYADLRGSHRLLAAPRLDPASLLERYERAQVQAVLLRATSVVADVRCRSPEAYRLLFQRLKFRRLLHRVERLDEGRYRISIDGPFSLFEAVTKYGLELALVLPALEACDGLELRARVLWGKDRVPLEFEHRSDHAPPGEDAVASVRDDVRALAEDFAELDSPWRCSSASELLELPGVGLCVPDLVFTHADGRAPVHVELLGFWSRAAVFRRIELVERGLAARIVFALSSKLRVSEELLDDAEHACLYVYRGKPSARGLERKLEAVGARPKVPRRRP